MKCYALLLAAAVSACLAIPAMPEDGVDQSASEGVFTKPSASPAGDAQPPNEGRVQPTGETPAAGLQPTAVARFLRDHPQAGFTRHGSRISRIYGAAFGFGADAHDTAEGFRRNHAALFGVAPDDLEPVSILPDGRHTQPVMYDRETGEYKFTLVYYSQYKDGIPVFRADLRLLVRNEPGHPLVLVGANLRDLGDFSAALNMPDPQVGRAAATALVPDLVNFTDPELVVWAGVDDMEVVPTVAVTFIGDNGMPATARYQKWLFVADAATGAILYDENLIISTDVVGNVKGRASQGVGADICELEAFEAMPYARVNIGATAVFANAFGDFVLPNGGSSPVTVQSAVRGQWFRVFNQAGADTVLSMNVTPPGPADFFHNSANNSEFIRAEVNGYVEANVVRSFTLVHNPAYPVIGSQTEFTVNVNINDICNAFYDGISINFFRAGGGCSNTANATVVHHEYGHHLVAVGGSGQGEYGEGMSDVVAVLITDTSKLAIGFGNNCSSGIRDANNSCQFQTSGCSSCGSEIHACGQLISGCVWSTRNELLATNPSTYRDILSDLAINSILLHSGSSITPSITVDFLTLDDDDGNINNGTPHYQEICTGFGAHNMDCPALSLIGFNYPDGVPSFVTPDQPTVFRVNVVPVSGTPVPGTGEVTFRVAAGPFTTVPMNEISPNQYEATLPAAACPQTIDFYVSAQDVGGLTVTDPSDAPATTFSAVAASGINSLVSYDFETNPGWTEAGTAGTGRWQRGVPVGCARGDPSTDFDGSGQCWLTENNPGDCNSDVDNGSTTLTSQVIDLGGLNDPLVTYARWYSNVEGNSPQQDTFVVQVSANGGASWQPLETVGPSGPEVFGGWNVKTFRIADFVTPSSQFRIRFTASDTDPQSVVEAAIDAFEIFDFDCTVPCPGATGDMDGNGVTNGGDLQAFVSGILGSPTPDEICRGDFNGNNGLDAGDIGGMVTALLAP